MTVSTLTVNRVKFSAKVEKKLFPAIGKSSMCHVYSNGGINNSKNSLRPNQLRCSHSL